ncbi:MAG: TIGR00282 family metallophosphoesterase [Candidatus Zixiibacteriota bacterium]|nr:MAG: TIGR00282 family metallophosphoesterase [candidate division Zixibacteria bacterium]
MKGTRPLNLLFIADIVGKPGRDITARFMDSLLRKYDVDFCIANGENAADGKGITPREFSEFRQMGVDVVTGGNHIFDRKEGVKLLAEESRLLRPLNYPPENPGYGSGVFDTRRGEKVAVLNLQGRTFMYPIEDPFRLGRKEIEKLRAHTPIIIVDFHAEATAEKQAMFWHLDGLVSAVIGTHTHVQTADERLLPGGTAVITDIGMTGPMDSVIGLDRRVALRRFLLGTPQRYEIAQENLRLNAALVSVDPVSGQAKSIQRISLP